MTKHFDEHLLQLNSEFGGEMTIISMNYIPSTQRFQHSGSNTYKNYMVLLVALVYSTIYYRLIKVDDEYGNTYYRFELKHIDDTSGTQKSTKWRCNDYNFEFDTWIQWAIVCKNGHSPTVIVNGTSYETILVSNTADSTDASYDQDVSGIAVPVNATRNTFALYGEWSGTQPEHGSTNTATLGYVRFFQMYNEALEMSYINSLFYYFYT